MWRFLLAGLGTIGGLALLFVGTFGDPTTLVGGSRPASPVEQTPLRAQAMQRQAPAAQVPEASAGPTEGTVFQRKRDTLRQLQGLEASLAQATQDIATLREQDDKARRELEDLRQRRATDLAALERARLDAQRDAEARQQRTAEAQQRAAEAEKQIAAEQAARQQRAAEAQQRAAEAEKEAAAEQARQQRAVEVQQHAAETERRVAAVQVAPQQPQRVEPAPDVMAPLDVKVLPPSRPAVATPPPRPAQASVKPAPAEPDARQAVLARLRRQVPSRNDTAQVASEAPRPASPRQRLMDARTALAAGRTDEAQHLLEQAQVQLVLRPVSPSQDASATGSVAAGQVAEALSMLGAGDLLHAIRYINLAVAQADQGPTVGTVAPAPVAGGPRPPRTSDDYYYGR